MQVYYYCNSERKQMLNQAGQDYTPAYIPELLSLLGVGANPISTQGLLDGVLETQDILLTGNEALPEGFRVDCTHIAFQTAGELSAFGIAYESEIPKTGDKYDIDGYCYCDIADRQLPLPVISSFAVVRPQGAETVAFAQVGERQIPAFLTYGEKYYFTFDLPATVWYAGDGRTLMGGKNGFSLGRVPDTRVVPLSYDTRIAYSDCYALLLQKIFYCHGVPMIHRLPPMEDGSAPDMLLYFSGDDDAYSAENDLKASDAMMQRGLPYHLNVMPADKEGNFVIDREQQEELLRRGCEIALHSDFTAISEYSEDGYRMQADMFERAFGRKSVSAVNHCLIQKGSCAERLRLQAKQGILGDNNKSGEIDESDINAFNLWGYAFGTAFPRFTLDDAAHGNARIDVVEIPITYYEPRLYSRSAEELDTLHTYLDQSAFWARMGSLFFHPHYISGVVVPAEPALAALDECMAYCDAKGYKVYKTAPDALTLWWHDRAASSICGISPNGFVLECAAASLVIRLPEGTADVYVDGVKANTEQKTLEGGVSTLLTVKGRGRHTIAYAK